MNKSDQQLDQQLAQADQSRLPTGVAPIGASIRRRAAMRQEIRLQKRRAAVGVLVVGCLLIGWRLLVPVPNQVAEPLELVEEFNTAELLAEIEALRKEREQIDDQLALLEANRRLRHVDFALKRMELTSATRQMTYRRQRDAWNTLQQLVGNTSEIVPESERWKLELLANGFPDTAAGSAAQLILTNNQTPESVFEKFDEL